MGQTRLPAMDPVLVHAIAITDQDPGPALNQRSKAALLRLACTIKKATVGLTITHNHANTPC